MTRHMEKMWKVKARGSEISKHTVLVHGKSPGEMPSGFPFRCADVNVPTFSDAPLKYVKALFFFSFQIYWGDHTHFTRAPRVVPQGFWVSPRSLMTDDR